MDPPTGVGSWTTGVRSVTSVPFVGAKSAAVAVALIGGECLADCPPSLGQSVCSPLTPLFTPPLLLELDAVPLTNS